MTSNLSASVRARLLNLAKTERSDFNQVLVRFALGDLLGFGPSDLESLQRTFMQIAAIEAEDGIRFYPDSVRVTPSEKRQATAVRGC